MRDYAAMQANMFAMSQRLKAACSMINARTAKYKSTHISEVMQAE